MTSVKLLWRFFSLLLFATTGSVVAQQPPQEVLLDSAWHLYEKGEYAQSRKINKRCIDESRAANDSSTQALCMLNIGTVAYVEGNFRDAYAWYDSSFTLYEQIGDTVQTVNALRNMALTSRRLSRYDQGIRHCNAALTLLRTSKKHEQLKGQVFNTLATLFESTNNLQQARVALRQAAARISSGNRPYVYTNLGNTYVKLGTIDSAIYAYHTALHLTNDSTLRGLILNNIGESYIICDSLKKAQEALMESLAIRKQIDPAALVSTYNNLVQLFLEKHEIKEADRYSVMVHAELSKQPNERESLKYFMLQKQYYERLGDFRTALKFDALHDSLNRKIFEEERIKAGELQAAYELGERDQLLAIQNQTLALRAAELERKTFLNRFIIGISILLILTATVFFYLYRINARLRYKNEMLIHEQSHRVKNNLQMIASLLSVQSSAHSDQRVKSVLTQNETRIQSVALLHRMLYNTSVSEGISLQQYLKDLTKELSFSLGAENAEFHVRTEIENLSIENTVSLGLILNELVTNSVKYASCNGKLEVSIMLTAKDKKAELRYTDNGNSFNPENFITSDRFGVRLISLQAKRLKGNYTITDAGGCCFVLNFPFS